MFLKVKFGDQIKKVRFHERYENIQEFRKLIAEITGYEDDYIRVFFFDVENEKIEIADSHDIEYFKDQNNSKFAEVLVEKDIWDVTHDRISVDNSKEEKEE